MKGFKWKSTGALLFLCCYGDTFHKGDIEDILPYISPFFCITLIVSSYN